MTELWRRIFGDTDENERDRKGYKLPAIVPIVLYNSYEDWTVVKSFRQYLSDYGEFGNRTVDFEYILLNVNRYEDGELEEIGTLLSSVFLLDKDHDSEQFKNSLKSISGLFTRLSNDEQVDLMDWLKDVLFKKVKPGEKEILGSTISNLKKGGANDMTYAIERIFDRIEAEALEKGRLEVSEKAHKEIEKARLEAKKASLEAKKVRLKAEKDRLAEHEKAQNEKIETAKKLLSFGLGLEQISEATNLPISKIEEIGL
ncbi:Rpn family recombination-promoting nuclease/putative transposase [Lachnospiraceae bacterium ZAX-1]